MYVAFSDGRSLPHGAIDIKFRCISRMKYVASEKGLLSDEQGVEQSGKQVRKKCEIMKNDQSTIQKNKISYEYYHEEGELVVNTRRTDLV